MSGDGARTIGSRTLRGMLWAYGSYMGARLLVLVFTAVLARLLGPSEFGLVSLALVFITFLDTLSDLGLNQALIVVAEEEVDDRANSVFAFSVVIGAGLALLTALLAPAAAAFFDEPDLTTVLPVLGSTLFLRALSSTHYALAQKRLDFKTRTAGEMADVGVRGVVGVVLAVAGLGAWSLVLGYLAGSVALGVVLWLLVPWRPRLRLDRSHIRSMLGYGGSLTGVDLIAALIANVDYVFVGRVLGTRELGLYTLGFKLPEMLILNLSVVAGRVLFPAFAALDRRSLGSGFLRSLHYTLMICLPLVAVLAVLGRSFVVVVFGEQWLSSVPVMQVLTVYALGVTVGIPAGTAYKASGRADVLLKLAVPRALLVVVSIALFVRQGILPVAACQAAVAGLFSLIGIGLAARLLGVSVGELWRAAWAPAAATAGMVVVLGAFELAIDAPLPALLAAGSAGAATYLALLWLLARESLRRLRHLAVPRVPADTVPADVDAAGTMA